MYAPLILNLPASEIQDFRPSFNNGLYTANLTTPGLWRLTRRPGSVYCVLIVNCGSWASAMVYDGKGRLLWGQPSAFTGSFLIDGYAEDGIVVDNGYKQRVAVNMSITWREAKL